ncbi:MAG: hypothetical protein V3U80_09955 [Flavobacteriaceae bacterium]
MSFLRKQESKLITKWIPAFAGMTVKKEITLTIFSQLVAFKKPIYSD